MFEGCGDFDVYAEINGPRRMYNQGKSHGVLLDNGKLDMHPFGPRILLPQHHYLDKIHEHYPNATFILNLRPVLDWVISVVKWPTTLKFELGHEFFAQQTERPWASHFSPVQKTISRYQVRSRLPYFLKWLYTYHNEFVRAFVAQYPSHALIEVDISRADAGEILAEAFGLDASCWGHVNKNKNKPRTRFNRDGKPMSLRSRGVSLMGLKQRNQNRTGVSSKTLLREQHEAIRESRLRERQQGDEFGEIYMADPRIMYPQSSHHRSGVQTSFHGGLHPPGRAAAQIEKLRTMKEKNFPSGGNMKDQLSRTISGAGKTKPWDLDKAPHA
jgi:hypothetical protein